MNKKDFELHRQLLWVYLRHNRKCTHCGQQVSLDEAATTIDTKVPLGIDDLIRVKLMHIRCREEATGRAQQRAA